MSPGPNLSPEDHRFLEIFRADAETQITQLGSGLLELDKSPNRADTLQSLMRAAHSLKGAARLVHLASLERLAHAMEDVFTAAQRGRLQLTQTMVDALLRGVDTLAQPARIHPDELGNWETQNQASVDAAIASLRAITNETAAGVPQNSVDPLTEVVTGLAEPRDAPAFRTRELPDRVLRLDAENLNRLLGLAGESLVESRWLRPFSDSLQRIRRQHLDVAQKLDLLRSMLEARGLPDHARDQLDEALSSLSASRQLLIDRLEELEIFDRRSSYLSHRLYLEVMRTRMRPFAEGLRRFPRMVRDLARSLGKEVRLEISGEQTQVDREILERLESPLAHLLRNALDHGCESTEDRLRAGKPSENVILLEARHSAGMLVVTVSDNGAGLQPDRVRDAIVQRGLLSPALASRLGDHELLEFLFLPGFTLSKAVTEISGRGVGLDVVQNMVKSLRGSIRLQNRPGNGFRVQLQLPLTLSVMRALLVEVAEEPYALPLSQVVQVLKLHPNQVSYLEGRPHFQLANQQVGLILAHDILESALPPVINSELPVVVLGDRNARYGIIFDRLLGERELVVGPLDPRLGKVRDIGAAALMENGAPILIFDTEDLLRSAAPLAAASPQPPLPFASPQNHLIHA